jgi:clan AA aspartic protease (TIGR02281 family)
MNIARGAGWLAGRMLRIGVRDEWGGFRRGLQTGLAGVVVVMAAADLAYYYWRDDLARRVIAPPRASAPAPLATHRLAGRLDENNQCFVRGTVGSVAMTFLVDSGASGLAFSRDHIRRLGVDPSQLGYNQPVRTANGIGRAALVTVDELRLGTFVLRDVPATVDYAGADYPLLGMSVLKYMQLEMGRGACALRW